MDDLFAYFGTQSGSLCIYNLNTFRITAVYPYLYSLKKKYLISPASMVEGMSGPAITKIFKSRKLPFMIQSYQTSWPGHTVMGL